MFQGITFDEFRSFFQFLNNLEDFAIAMQMYNFAARSIGQGRKRVVGTVRVSAYPHRCSARIVLALCAASSQNSLKDFTFSLTR